MIVFFVVPAVGFCISVELTKYGRVRGIVNFLGLSKASEVPIVMALRFGYCRYTHHTSAYSLRSTSCTTCHTALNVRDRGIHPCVASP